MTSGVSIPDRSGDLPVTMAGVALVLVFAEVGWASGERIRHLIQAVPAVAATVVAWRWPSLGRWALAPVFAVWMVISALIWMFLLGLPSPLHGHFNPWERIGAAGLGLVPLIGFAFFPQVRRPLAWPWAVAVFLIFGGLQVAAIVLSTQPAVASR